MSSNSTGSNNSAIGFAALGSNTSASRNTAVGYQAGYANTTGANNTAVGYQAGYTNATGVQGVFLGYQAGYITTGNYNTYLGYQAGVNATSGTLNTFIGNGSGSQITSGGKNVILGSYNGNQGGLDIRTASNYVVLSDGDGNPRGIFDNNGNLLLGTTSIIDGASGINVAASSTGGGVAGGLIVRNTASSGGDASPPLVISKTMTTTTSSARFVQFYANNAATAMGGIVGNGASNVQFAALSDVREKTNIQSISGSLDKINALRPVEFDWITEGSHVNAGFIAQEVETVFPEFVIENVSNDGQEERKGLTGGMTGGIIPHLVKAIQEQQALIEQLRADVETLKGQA